MLFVFHVDTGTMMTFEMSLALESVNKLKDYVEGACKIPADKQVLLISGGECLDPNSRVCSYSAGTDTNPIFLFSKSIIESTVPPSTSVDYGSDDELRAKVKECVESAATYATVVKNAQLAQQFYEVAKDVIKMCDKLVLDQHLQQQGWFAVVANLEDITAEFKKRSEIFEKGFADYMAERESFIDFLKHFDENLTILQKIPVLPMLLELEKSNMSEVELESENGTTFDEPGKDKTLFEWISAADNKNSMDQLYEHCSRGLEQFDLTVLHNLGKDVEEMLKSADDLQMKEIKGLGERLSGLENIMRTAKSKLQDQHKLAQSFLKNQTTASNLQDTSILPDLCASHKAQLFVMESNHKLICDIRRRCTKAKEELSVNLYHRLKWVMYIESRIVEIDQKLVIYHENLKRLRRHLEVLQQIHMAPATYLNAVAEVVRRRAFSQSFLTWASEMACFLLTIHNDEVTRRKEFQLQFDGHFLNSLFPGMDDLPPAFATEAPAIFDSALPKITQADVDRLKNELPDLAEHLLSADVSEVINFFLTKSVKLDDNTDEAKAVEEKLVQGGNVLSTPHGLPHLKDLDRGCESETDTEEFEKVGQSPLELHFDKEIPSPRPGTQDAATLTEDNLQISRSEHERTKSMCLKLGSIARETAIQLRSELSDLKANVCTDRDSFNQQYLNFNNSWTNLVATQERFANDSIASLKRNYEAMLEGYRKVEVDKAKQLADLQADKAQLTETVDKLGVELRAQSDKFAGALLEKDVSTERALKELEDTLTKRHKDEMESMRSRFKLMTMERSPSDNSLEKIGEFSSLPNHETILSQLNETFELQKDRAIAEALAKQAEVWETSLNEKVAEMLRDFEVEKERLLAMASKRVAEEKDRQLEVLRERERNLNLEIVKYKGTIVQLTENSECHTNELLERIDVLQQEKAIAEEKLAGVELAASVAVVEDKVDATTSPIKHKESVNVAAKPLGKLNVESCKVGDHVVVIWDQTHESFKILQENKYMFFLHSDCLPDLCLEIANGRPNKSYCLGEVVDKEYCHARKSENRYKVARGTKFFRIKVKPLSFLYAARQTATALMQSHMSQSHTTSTCTEISEELTQSLQSLPTSPTRLYSTVIKESLAEETNPDELRPTSGGGDKKFGDSGIVESMSVDDNIETHPRNESESSDRYLVCATKVDVQHSYVSSRWLDLMFSRMFAKSCQNL